jgi:hypothetical protein
MYTRCIFPMFQRRDVGSRDDEGSLLYALQSSKSSHNVLFQLSFRGGRCCAATVAHMHTLHVFIRLLHT